MYILAFAVPALLLLLTIYIILVPGPNVSHDERTFWLKRVPIAHRGLHTNNAEVPENSMEAFRRAMMKGFAIELDVHLTLDGKVAVIHDKSLMRMTGCEQNIDSITSGELQNFKLLGTLEGIPLLTEVLSLVDGRVPLLIEIKNGGSPGRLEDAVIEDLKNYKGHFAIQSFNPFVLSYIKQHAPGYVRGQLSGSFKGERLAFYKKLLLRYLVLNNVSSPCFVAYQTNALPKWLSRRLRMKGLYLLSWTIRDMDDYQKAKGDFDNVIFEGFEVP